MRTLVQGVRGARRASVPAWLCAAVLGLAVFALPEMAAAQTRSLQSGPAVRRQLLYRSDRVELTPALGMGIGSVYRRTAFGGLSVRYHLTNSVSFGANAQFGAVHFNTSIASDFEDQARELPPSSRPELAYAEPLLLADFHFGYVPFHGKFALFGKHTIHYDFHILLGVAVAMVQSDSDDLSGTEFGPSIGVGVRTFFSDQLALNIRFQDYLYSSADAQRVIQGIGLDVEESFRHHIVGLVGLSIFFPSDVRVSR